MPWPTNYTFFKFVGNNLKLMKVFTFDEHINTLRVFINFEIILKTINAGCKEFLNH